MRILLADDQYRIRFALRALLSQQPGLEIVGEAVEAQSVLAQAEAAQPDLVLLAWELPGLSALDLLHALQRVCPRVVVIVLSSRPEARAAVLQAGADAFVSKIDPPTRLLAAIHQVGENVRHCSGEDSMKPTQPVPTSASVTLEYIGNSCFLITAPDGTRIVSDPYHDSPRPPGLAPLPSDLIADAVTVSHTHADHNNAEAVGGSPQVLTDAGVFQIGLVKVTGYAGREGSPSGPSDNPHVVFVFETRGVKIVQMGDSGPITQPDVLAAIENADVLLANIDGYVIPPDQLLPFVRRAGVRTFIPTHYSLSQETRWCDAPTIDEFLKTLPADLAVTKTGSQIQVRPNMPQQVAVLAPRALAK